MKVKPLLPLAFQSSRAAFQAVSVSTEFQRFVWSIDASVTSGVVHWAVDQAGEESVGAARLKATRQARGKRERRRCFMLAGQVKGEVTGTRI